MATARAFSYLRYDPDVTGDPGVLLAPPYDVVSREQVAALAERSPYQAAIVESPVDGDTAAAARTFAGWIESEALIDGEVGVAVIKQRFVGPDGVRRTRTGVVCEVGLAPFGEDVLPHEQTFDAPTRLRQRLMAEVGANVSPVFLLYHDPEHSLTDLVSSITDDEPDFTSIEAEDVQTAVWFVTDPSMAAQVEQAVAPHRLLIADGHHRYTAALAHRDAVRAEGRSLAPVGGPTGLAPHTDSSGVDGILAVVANSADAGIAVFPTHRLLHGVDSGAVDELIADSAALETVDAASVLDALAQLDALIGPGFVVYAEGRARVVRVHDPASFATVAANRSEAWRSLDVAALHGLVLDGDDGLAKRADRLAYTRELYDAIAAADADPSTVAFLVRGIPAGLVHDVAMAGDVMPQKSTYYFPKVPTGIVYRRL